MPAWGDLSRDELQGVAAFVSSLGPAVAPPTSEAILLQSGAAVFATHCATCHGSQGGGNGVMAGVLRPVPPNFHELQPSAALARQAIREGVPGTAMPAWPNLTEAEVNAVAAFVRSLYGIPVSAAPTAAAAPRGRP